ncbi:hypothetical protein CROQUDRAFT_668998 [Cronartium quercuum f. sp. fusiforme G11]|uniref:Uncharacterized protein n=1 Tax=Cronartium quercuum f. sp. fusiforme G11 TaxID=708437 RepID=A0A9P6NT57_9BASI|nr:hypothetical protein CROQUDRAFT_668998 [Cronartium quercuum f. sp. fusiforme G11]
MARECLDTRPKVVYLLYESDKGNLDWLNESIVYVDSVVCNGCGSLEIISRESLPDHPLPISDRNAFKRPSRQFTKRNVSKHSRYMSTSIEMVQIGGDPGEDV